MIDFQMLGEPTLKNVLERFEKNLLTKLNCAKVGKIKTFYSDKQTADIEIDGYPIISGVPVSFISGANFSIQVPINKGDACIVLFCDGDLDNWVENGKYIPAFPDDKHGLNGAIALLGITNLLTKVENYITNGIRIKYKDTELEVGESGISVKGDLSVSGDIVATGKIEAGNGATGTFTDTGTGASGRTLTITKGIITQIT